MRVLGVVLGMVLAVGVAVAQAPSTEPFGDLAEVMRGILFPNSNLIFDAQTRDPGAPRDLSVGDTVTVTFSNIYSGWEIVENAAVALVEAANLIMLPGRLCENGRPVPVEQVEWSKYVQGLKVAGEITYKAARAQDQDAVIEATNDVVGSCENCHIVYRDKPGDAPRCVP